MSEFRKVENIETTKDTEITKDTIVFHPKYGEIRAGELIRRIKISQAKKGIKRPEEFRKKMSEIMKRLGIKPPTWNKGRNSRITIICENCGKSFLVNPSALKYGRKYCSLACAYKSEKYRKRLSEVRKGHKFSDETRRKISESRKKYFSNPLNRIKQSEIMKGKPHPDIRGDKSPTKRPEVKAKIGAKNKVKIKEFYQTHPWYREMHRHIGALVHKSQHHRPNKLESSFYNSFKDFVEYTGDGKLIIGNRIPDFIVKGKKKVIELFGTYWHKPQEEKPCREHYERYGYECLVIWEHDFYNNFENVKKEVYSYIGDNNVRVS